MKVVALLAVLLLASFAHADEDSAVVVLTDATFDEAIKQGPILVEFYAPWCGHCKQLAPEWEKAAEQLKAEGSNLRLGKVDCTVEKEAAQRFEVSGFPTIKLFKNGETDLSLLIDYRGERKADAIVSWLKKKTGPVTVTLASKEELDNFVNGVPAAVVGFFSQDSDARKAFETAASDPASDNYAFGLVTDSAVISAADVSEGAVKLFRNFDSPLLFEGELESKAVVSWVLAHAHPYLDDAPSSWNRFMVRQLPIVLLFADEEDASYVTLQSWFTRIARDRIQQFNFGHVGKHLHNRLSQLGASGEKIPTLVVLNHVTGKNYPFDETKEFNAADVDAFLEGVASGQIKPHFKSQPIPETQEGPVTVLVGNSFQSVVLDSDNDVLVEFYAPWCGHCKHLAPIYDELAKFYQEHNGKVVIASLDSTANDNPSVNIRGFPTLYFFAAGHKDQPIEYKGDRTLQDMIKFVEEHATNKSPEAAVSAAAPSDSHDSHDHDEL